MFAKKGSWAHKDWLLHKDAGPATIQENICWEDGLCGLELSNGLLTRRWTLQNKPAFGTVDLLMRDKAGSEISMLRAIEPEAWVAIDGKEYRVGDLIAKNGFRAYLNRTSIQESLQSIPQTQNNCTFRYASHRITKIRAPFSWTPGTRHSLRQEWPPPGIGLEVDLRLEGINMTQTRPILVTLHYELYDGIPVMAKWLTVTLHDSDNDDDDSDESTKKSTQFIINSVNIERIASYPPYGAYLTQGSSPPFLLYNGESSGVIRPPPLLVSFTDQAHGAQCQWIDDYLNSNDTDTSEPHDMGASEPLLTCNYTLGPHAVLRSTQIENSQGKHHDRLPQSIFTSFKTFLLATDTSDPERQTLMKHRMTQVLLPHTTENPLFFHFLPVVHSEAEFRRAVDQMTEVGFEMLIYSFGAGFQLESSDATYLEYIKRQVGYAKVHNIEVGGYDLICLQRGHGGYGENLPDEWVRINDHGDLSQDVCYGSKWYNKLNELVFHFINTTGLSPRSSSWFGGFRLPANAITRYFFPPFAGNGSLPKCTRHIFLPGAK